MDTAHPEMPPVPPPIVLPEVLADGRVTFRILDPNALEVFLELDGARPMMMQKDEMGLWSVTTAPQQAGLIAIFLKVHVAQRAKSAPSRLRITTPRNSFNHCCVVQLSPDKSPLIKCLDQAHIFHKKRRQTTTHRGVLKTPLSMVEVRFNLSWTTCARNQSPNEHL